MYNKGYLNDKVAVVTGGSKGIGASITEELAQEGAIVIANYNKDLKKAEELVEKVKEFGGYVSCLPGDVTDEEHMLRLAETVKSRFGRIDILVNNAGITQDKIFSKMEANDWNKVIDTNLNGIYNSTHSVLPIMKEQKEGSIVNISSIIGQMGAVGQVNYSAAKAGVIGFTKSLAHEMARYNIRVNAVCPGFVNTAMTEKIPENIKEKLVSKIPMGRFAEKEEVAKTVRFLVTEGTYITGQEINVNGGMYM
ncbi:3-oxoacyl-[acyl-carrier-protein] reductase [Natranaerofaba carboxydovora]|uniref:3-oxoacyl-[acyl-carrier-protein] reductase n=1 Tax=Natranaerofaba carboxydovora TaxID=2742683 RepID=UPI001F1302FF|nr:3-oxoacyl-[acyl-carrier-protein] reductase [Natranaerofaba carboxydovora]UMZ73686.1 3-oxoacyl-[acyl-carrier-protein] reductase FabG [Natranaerofaba carboxydovora]